MTDRELLELAAKAAGITGTLIPFYDIDGEIEGYDFVVKGCPWNPLTDDGDALLLAVKLQIDIRNFHSNEVAAQFKLHDQPGWQEHSEDRGADPYAATRRAIVRAAAEIGKEMK